MGQDRRKDDAADRPDLPGAVHRRRFELFRRNGQHAGMQDENDERGPLPDVDQHQAGQRQRRRPPDVDAAIATGQRGELREDVDDTLAAVLIVMAPLQLRALYSDAAVDDDYCAAIADMAWHALARK